MTQPETLHVDELDVIADAFEMASTKLGLDLSVIDSDEISLGGFNWSSQRPEKGGCDGHSEAAVGSMWSAAIAVARPATGGHA